MKNSSRFWGSSLLSLGLWAVGIPRVLHHESSLIEKCTIENPSCDDYKKTFLEQCGIGGRMSLVELCTTNASVLICLLCPRGKND